MRFHEDLIQFFKNHHLYDQKMFNYFSKNATMIDYRDEEQRSLIGCFYIFDKKNILRKIHLNLPYIYDEKTMLISIHELLHGIELYKKLNKKTTITDECEVLPMLYEKIYVEESQSEELKRYHQQLDSKINEDKPRYLLALAVREELYEKYNYDINKMKRMSKRLVRKHNKKQQANI